MGPLPGIGVGAHLLGQPGHAARSGSPNLVRANVENRPSQTLRNPRPGKDLMKARDRHAVPLFSGEHRASARCGCQPTESFDLQEPSVLIWVHHPAGLVEGAAAARRAERSKGASGSMSHAYPARRLCKSQSFERSVTCSGARAAEGIRARVKDCRSSTSEPCLTSRTLPRNSPFFREMTGIAEIRERSVLAMQPTGTSRKDDLS